MPPEGPPGRPVLDAAVSGSDEHSDDAPRRLAEVTTLYEIARGLLGARDPRQVAWRTVYSGLGALGARCGAMFVADERGRYRRLCAAGLSVEPASETLTIPAEVRDWMLREGTFGIGGSAARTLGELRERLLEHEAVIGAAVPTRRGLAGLVVFGRAIAEPGDVAADRTLLESLASLAGLALEAFASGGAAAREAPWQKRDTGGTRPSRAARTLAALREEHRPLRAMIGESRPLLEACTDLAAVAATKFPVLLTGESGVGKEVAARAVHEISDRADGPLEIVDCGSIPSELIESELFGHVRGAFTGAQRDRRGAFELAHRGTLFLDEIGEMPLQLQTRLLRVLQEGRFRRVGDERLVDVDVRIVAATNRDLSAAVAARLFRQDLFYRLNVFAVRLPALRERTDDIGLLMKHFLVLQGREIGVRNWRVEDDVVRALELYEWPGNIRELVNLCAALVVHVRDRGVVTPADLAHVWKRQHVGGSTPWDEGASPKREHLGDWVLEQARGSKFNLVELARLLQRQKRAGQRVPLTERSALSYYLTGEILRALAAQGGDPEAAARALGGEDDLAARVRARVRKTADTLRQEDGGPEAVRRRFPKLPAGYEDAVEQAWQAVRD